MAELLASWAAEERWMYPAFLAMYTVIYCVGQLGLFRRWEWRHRLDGASCLISLAHGSAAAFAAVAAIASQPAGNRGFAAPNSRIQDHVLDYSVAYFTMDLLHYLAFLPGDILFIAHHLATLFVFFTCRYVVHHGAYALLVLLFLAEVTSLLQNVWTLAGIWRAEVPAAARVYNTLSPPFYVLYTIVRGVAGPLFFLKMSLFYLSGQAVDLIPWWVRISWIIVVGAAITQQQQPGEEGRSTPAAAATRGGGEEHTSSSSNQGRRGGAHQQQQQQPGKEGRSTPAATATRGGGEEHTSSSSNQGRSRSSSSSNQG